MHHTNPPPTPKAKVVCLVCGKAIAIKVHPTPALQGACAGCTSRLEATMRIFISMEAAHTKALEAGRTDLGAGPKAYIAESFSQLDGLDPEPETVE